MSLLLMSYVRFIRYEMISPLILMILVYVIGKMSIHFVMAIGHVLDSQRKSQIIKKFMSLFRVMYIIKMIEN